MTALLQLDVAFEEVDQMDLANNAAVKGVLAEPQQPQLLAVHQMASKAEQFIVLADASQVICALMVAARRDSLSLFTCCPALEKLRHPGSAVQEVNWGRS